MKDLMKEKLNKFIVDTNVDFPKIDVNKSYGAEGVVFNQTFSFYYSSKIDTPTEDKYGIADNSYFKENASAAYSDGKVKLTPEVFWPNHTTKYFFRGVYPATVVDGTTTSPSVTEFTDIESKSHQGIKVENSAYNSSNFPSNLMVGIPLQKNEDGTLKVDEETGKARTVKGYRLIIAE